MIFIKKDRKEDKMIQLNYRDAKPIYEQIRDGFKNLLVSGVIKTDEKLPSVRDLAASMTINPNTIQKAYDELEQEGYIYIRDHREYASNQQEIVLLRKEELFYKFDTAVLELLDLSIKKDVLNERINILERESKKRDTGE